MGFGSHAGRNSCLTPFHPFCHKSIRSQLKSIYPANSFGALLSLCMTAIVLDQAAVAGVGESVYVKVCAQITDAVAVAAARQQPRCG
jgi:hypothetical protein